MKSFIILFIFFIILCSKDSFAQYQPTYSDTLMILGKHQYEAKDYTSAIEHLDSCIHLNPKNDVCLYYRGKIAYDMKQYELSKSIFKAVLSLAERDDVSWNMLGLSFQELKQYDSAEFCFKNAVAINSKESRFFSNWGKNEYLRGNLAHAEQLYNTAILINAQYANHYQGRAEVRRKMGKKIEAVEDLKNAQSIEPENNAIRQELSQIEEKDYSIFILFGGIFLLLLGFLIWKKRKDTKGKR